MNKSKITQIETITSLLYDFNTAELKAIYKALWNIQQEGKHGLFKRNNKNLKKQRDK